MKKNNEHKFIVFVDDIVIMIINKKASTAVYYDMFNHFKSVGLDINLAKVQQGTFSSTVLDFCGWRFAGGYSSISMVKIDGFRERIANACNSNITKNPRVFIKLLNAQINGFGHYYKYGEVVGVYQKLDGFIRQSVKKWFVLTQQSTPTNQHLRDLGLRSLYDIKTKKLSALITNVAYKKKQEIALTQKKNEHELLMYFLSKLVNQNVEIISQLKKISTALNM